MKFDHLVEAISSIHQQTEASAAKAVNMALTCRNWLIGAYIHEYELNGQDRADYGDRVMVKLAATLKEIGIPGCNRRRLYRFTLLYRYYPQIVRSLTPQFQRLLPGDSGEPEPIMASLTPLSGELILERLSYTHLELLVDIEDPLKRHFYEVEAIKGNWSVRELKRQVATLYFERSGLSHDKEGLSRLANADAESTNPQHVIRDPYIFEFLGLRPQEVLPESDLETALLLHLQRFLVELGNGFCFEARQKRITIGGDAFFVDLVFYHRILKCHVLVELKVDEFRHEHLGQLNTYVSF